MIKMLPIILVVLAFCHLSQASSGGYESCTAFNGGGPHGARNTGLGTPTITGLPTAPFRPNTAYTLTLKGAADFTGYALTASVGTMAPAGNGRATCDGKGIGHTNGGQKTQVTATWTSPASGDVTFNAVLVAGGYANSVPATVKGPAAPTSSSSSSTGRSSSSSSSTATTDPDEEEPEPEPVVATLPDVWVGLVLTLNVYDDYPTQDDFEAEFIPEFASLLNIDPERVVIKKYSAPKATAARPDVKVAITVQILNEDYPEEEVSRQDVADALEIAKEDATGVTLAAISSFSAYTAGGGNAAGPKSQPSTMGSGAVAAIVVVVLLAVIGGAGGYWYWTKKRAAGGNMKAAASNVSSAPSSAQTSTDGWTKVWDENTKHYYYFNSKTSESRWTPPPGVTF